MANITAHQHEDVKYSLRKINVGSSTVRTALEITTTGFDRTEYTLYLKGLGIEELTRLQDAIEEYKKECVGVDVYA